MLDWVKEHASRKEGYRVLITKPKTAHVVQRPKTALPRTPRNIEHLGEESVPEVYVVELARARIATTSLEIIAPDDNIFVDLHYGIPAELYPASSLVRPLLPRMKEKTGRYAIIHTSRASNYYHWINDCLPRLWLLEMAGEEKTNLVVPKVMPRFQKETLDLLGYTGDRCEVFGNEHWRVASLVAPSLVSGANQSSPAAVQWLRAKFLARMESIQEKTPDRIFISRAGATKRRLLNESDIMPYLNSQGFVSYQLETLSILQQSQLFRNANIVLAPHGAGFANLIFMQPGSQIIELFPYRRTKTTSVSLASALGIQYSCLTDAPDILADESEGWASETDFSIPVRRIEAMLKHLNIY